MPTTSSAWSQSTMSSRPPSPTTGDGENLHRGPSSSAPPTTLRPTPPPQIQAVMTVAEPEITDATPQHTPVGLPEPRPSAVLDYAHLGDIEGALGRMSLSAKESTPTFQAPDLKRAE